MKELSKSMIDQLRSSFSIEGKNCVAMNAVTSNGINNSATNPLEYRNCCGDFSTYIKSGNITNQKQSGRCWMFASLNLMRNEIIYKLNLDDVELSENYPLFFDKLEKSNSFLENIIETHNEPLDSRIVEFILTDPMGDGGHWDMFKSLVKKYGIVPNEAMPETEASSNTEEMDKYLTSRLRKYAKEIRESLSSGESVESVRKRKLSMLETIYRMLCISLGVPPKTFTFEVRDKDNKFIRDENITPQIFYEKYVGLCLDDFASIINSPTDDKPFGNTYSDHFSGKLIEKDITKDLNLPIEDIKDLTIKQLKDGKAVWFGCDVDQYSIRDDGILSTEILNIEALFSTDISMSKKDRLMYQDSTASHAMLLTGVNIDSSGRPNRFRVENSWGDMPGKNGYFIMTETWFDNFVYQVVIHKKYLSDKQKQMLEKDPIMLNPWDPMGRFSRRHKFI